VEFDAEEVLGRLDPENKRDVLQKVRARADSRQHARYERLEEVEAKKWKLERELDLIEYQILENDEWYENVKKVSQEVGKTELNERKKLSQKLYGRKIQIEAREIPEVELQISRVVNDIQLGEKRESKLKQNDMIELLRPFFEQQGRKSRERLIQQSRIREEERQRELDRKNDLDQAENLKLAAKSLEERKRKIQFFVESRGIKRLIHFTPVENLGSILERGICPRSLLDKEIKDKYKKVDGYRFDGNLDSVSMSITFPNYQMFYLKRAGAQRADESFWVVLEVDPEIMWTHECAFYPHNAASGRFSRYEFSHFSSLDKLRAMFDELGRNSSTPHDCPTDPQAEIMVKGAIPAEKILKIWTERKDLAEKLSGQLGRVIDYGREYFKPRVDHQQILG